MPCAAILPSTLNGQVSIFTVLFQNVGRGHGHDADADGVLLALGEDGHRVALDEPFGDAASRRGQADAHHIRTAQHKAVTAKVRGHVSTANLYSELALFKNVSI